MPGNTRTGGVLEAMVLPALGLLEILKGDEHS